MSLRSKLRQGVTLVELMLSLIVTAIVGAALIRMVTSQARFMDQQEAWRGARSVARGGVNRLFSDLRAVEATGGLTAAAAGGQDFTVRVPYAFGVLCGITAGNVYTLSLLPVDSAMFAAPGYSGVGWRDAGGVYRYTATTTLNLAGTTALCQNGAYDSIHTLPAFNGSPAGRVVNVVNTGGAIPGPVPPRGSIFLMYRSIRYEFKASAIPELAGRTALWRTTLGLGGSAEELAAPFANTARVNFYVLNNATPQAAVPGTLSDTRGLELVLDGMSEQTPRGSTAPKTANVITSVFFENRPD